VKNNRFFENFVMMLFLKHSIIDLKIREKVISALEIVPNNLRTNSTRLCIIIFCVCVCVCVSCNKNNK